MGIIEQYGHGLEIPKDELTAIERDRLLSEGKEVDRIMCCIDTGETLAPMIGLKVRDYYFSSQKMLELEQYIYDTFHSDGAGLSTTLRGMAEAMGSKIRYFDHNIAQLEQPALASLGCTAECHMADADVAATAKERGVTRAVVSMAKATGWLADFFTFLGTPIMALAVGTVLAIIQLLGSDKKGEFYELTNDTLKTVGPILFVTAAGGVLGKVIASSDMVNFIKAHASVLQAMGIFFPFLLSAILKSAQGSSTVAITTTAGIVAPLLPVLGFATPVEISLVVMAIGAGAMTVSHANDSYFWVVTNFGEMTPEQGYKTQTLMTLVIGLASMVEIFILNLIF